MTRMWMVEPKLMCRQHLLGEHKELHQLFGHLRVKKRVDKYITNNCLEISSLKDRHEEIREEMERRGYNHKSPMNIDQGGIMDMASYLPSEHILYIVDSASSLVDLLCRCEHCNERMYGEYLE